MSTAIQTTTIKITTTLDGMTFSINTVVPKHGSKAGKAAQIRDLADQIAGFVEAPRRAPRV